MTGIIVLLGLALLGSALSIRLLMIDAGMVRDLLAADPTFQPTYNRLSLKDQFDRKVLTHHAREYRHRFPDGRLTAKRRHTIWALGLMAVLAVAALQHWPMPR